MGRKLSPEQRRIYKAIDEILWEDWDPIGMKYNEGPREEYDSEVPVIFSLKINGADIETIARKLHQIESNTMDMDGGYENCKLVAEKIFNL
ncbi:MAG TPA: hypothetical protein VG367_18005 [Mucilaginibacter sp.]|jgi:hypothetical protein|nr:hypothetical protein [Mucilaginibacter sp.]